MWWINFGACATPQRRPRHELAWIWTDFLSEQRPATGLVETAGGVAKAGGKRQPARCSCKTQHKFAIASMAKKLLHRCICAHARAHMHFLRRVLMCISTGVVSTMHVQVRTLDRCCEHQRTHLLTRSLQDVHMRSCICSLVIYRWGNENWGVQLVYESTYCLVWGVIFDIWKDRGVVCVFSIFNAGESVYGCMCVYTHTNTHTLHRWGTRMWAQESGWDTWRAQRIQMD